MNEEAIRERLVARGEELLNAERKPLPFTKHTEADALLNDLIGHPHAFVLASLMNRQIKAEQAWMIPYELCKQLDGFSMEALRSLSKADVTRRMAEVEPQHRCVKALGGIFYSAVQRIAVQYCSDASRIWAGNPPSAEVVYRFLEFAGAEQKIASLATSILAKGFKIWFSDYYSIDISTDVHVRRVFGRLGLCPLDATAEEMAYKAKALYPKFPGLIDLPCREIGRNWCKAGGQECRACYMNNLCPSSSVQAALLPARLFHQLY